jgi:deoxyribodipyrimidine photo-lyase
MTDSSGQMVSPGQACIVWFRHDLRLADNPALAAAVASGRPVIAVFILDDTSPGLRPLGGAARWWLHGSLDQLKQAMRATGADLLLFRGDSGQILSDIVKATGAAAVFWNRRYGAAERAQDSAIKEKLKASGIEARSFNSHLLHEPWEVKTKTETPFKVFTPFWRAARERGAPAAPLPAPKAIRGAAWHDAGTAAPVALSELALKPLKPNWAAEMETLWEPGEKGARDGLGRFLETAIHGYGENRNRPDFRSTSRLSPHLRFGEISPRQIWASTSLAFEAGASAGKAHDFDKFLAEIGWREFSYHLLYQFPDLPRMNFQTRFDAFPWRKHPEHLQAWQQGRTGYPIVDAGMRELWRTGWMHNRVRMIVASFLIKHLMIDWRVGEEWFWDTLVDADPASNAASWQWVAGSGADAAPYYRIFAPVLQGEKFDPQGEYVRKYVPELSALPNDVIHKPWEASHPVLTRAGIRLGTNYPLPIVSHIEARDRALLAFKSLTVEAAA